MGRKKPYGYLVSCPRIPHGKFCKTMREAKIEMNRQMVKTRSSSSGISEVWTKPKIKLTKKRRTRLTRR